MKTCLQHLKTQRSLPNSSDFEKAGITYASIKHNFGSIAKLLDRIKTANPGLFKSIKFKTKDEVLDDMIQRLARAE